MRVLALVSDAYSGEGGIARYNRDLLAALGTLCDRVEVVVHPRVAGATGRIDEIPAHVRALAPQPGGARYVIRALAAALRDGPWTWVLGGHLHLAPLAMAAARVARARSWVQVHGIEAWHRPAWPRAGALERADLVTAVSRFTRARVLGWARIAEHRVRVLPNTLDPRFSAGPAAPGIRERLGVGAGPLLLTVGRLAPRERYKGQDRVIRVLPGLLAAHPGLRYLVVGRGEDRARLERLAADHGVSGRVHFAAGVTEAELVEVYRAADVFAMPSDGEGFGIVFLEAAACGVRVVGGAVDGSVDALADGEIGEAVDPGDEAALAGALDRALRAPRAVPPAIERYRPAAFARHLGRLLLDPQATARA